MTRLVFLSGPRKGTKVRLERSVVGLGREHSNEVPVDDANASRRHAELFLREGAYYVRDLHSTNGTILNGAPILEERRLASGDNIIIGDTVLMFEDVSSKYITHSISFRDETADEESRQLVLDPKKSRYLDPSTIVTRPEAAERLSQLYRFIAGIAPILTIERLSSQALDLCLEAIHADRGFIMLKDEVDQLRPAAMRLKSEDAQSADVQVSRRMTEKVLDSGESILSMDSLHDNRFKDSLAIVQNKISSFICAPLKSSERVLGLLYVDTVGMTPVLTEEDLQLATAMALLAGAQFASARLYGELLNSHEYTQSILRCLRSGVVVTGTDGTVQQVNAAACELFEMREDELASRRFEDFQMFRPIWKVIDETLRSGISMERQELIIEVSGENVPVGVSTSLLRDHENNVRGVVSNFRSLSVIKKLTEQVRLSQHLAALGEMAAGIAHEIRNPLNSIRGFTQLLETFLDAIEDEEKASSARNYVNIVIEEVDRMNQLVQDLLDFSRQREITMTDTDIVRLVEDVLVEMGPELQDANVRLDTQFESDMPLALGNAPKLKQVLVNVIKNALQAMMPPAAPVGRPRKLEVAVRRGGGPDDPGSQVCVAVKDSGMGISDKAIARIFEPFFTTRDKGTGLGLAICRKIVEQHSGTIEVETQLGAGTTMRIVLPARRSAHSA